MNRDTLKIKVLIVEDNDEDFANLHRQLQEEFVVTRQPDFDVYGITEKLKEVNVVLTDIYEDRTAIPKGLDIIKAIRAQVPKRRVPVIVMSVYGKLQVEHLAEAMEGGGAQDYVWKRGPQADTTDELIFKIKNARRRVLEEMHETFRRKIVFRAFIAAVVVLAVGTVVSALTGIGAATLSLQALLILVSVLAAFPVERHL